MMASYRESLRSRRISVSSKPSVITLTAVDSATRSVKRTAKPTSWPSSTLSSSAMRWAVARAAMRRGWVWPIMALRPKPARRQILGSWVVLPEPVSPATITTW